MKFIKWLNNTFPQKEFMLRSTGGIKYFKLGTAMQIILISLLITTGFFVGLFTYKMQFLQTVNYKQNGIGLSHHTAIARNRPRKKILRP